MGNTYYEKSDDIEYMQGEKILQKTSKQNNSGADAPMSTKQKEFHLTQECFKCHILKRCFMAEQEIDFFRDLLRAKKDESADFAEQIVFKNRYIAELEKKVKKLKKRIRKLKDGDLYV